MSDAEHIKCGQCCPKCGGLSSVEDSRARNGERVLRRRRECMECKHRWTTWELDLDDLRRQEDAHRHEVETSETIKDLRRLLATHANKRIATALGREGKGRVNTRKSKGNGSA